MCFLQMRYESGAAHTNKEDFLMSRGHKYLSTILLSAALFSPVVFTGCAARASYRVYDPAYEDYHAWDNHEGVYYQRWEFETHRDHRELKKRNSDEQREYWTWRHNHPDDKR
jgi:hypothetical protein